MMAPRFSYLLAAMAALLAFMGSTAAAASCNSSALNTTTGLYYISEYGTTIFDVANATNRGVCDIGRHNLMADVEILPNVGEQILIPAQVCEPDNETCLLSCSTAPRDCIYGGPRLYYTVNGDTYERIALYRLNITVEALMANDMLNRSATDVLEPGQFIKVPQCYPSQCVMQPYSFTYGVYKDLADRFGTTVGQIMMLSPTYNYSSIAMLGGTPPPIGMAINCTALSSNLTVLD